MAPHNQSTSETNADLCRGSSSAKLANKSVASRRRRRFLSLGLVARNLSTWTQPRCETSHLSNDSTHFSFLLLFSFFTTFRHPKFRSQGNAENLNYSPEKPRNWSSFMWRCHSKNAESVNFQFSNHLFFSTRNFLIYFYSHWILVLIRLEGSTFFTYIYFIFNSLNYFRNYTLWIDDVLEMD